jgi:hypothetical protein
VSHRTILIWAVAGFAAMVLFSRFVISESWGHAVILGLIIGVIAPAGEMRKRRRKADR